MQVSPNEVEKCLRKVEEVREYIRTYSIEPLGFVLNLADLHYAVQDICSMKIDVIEVSFEGQHLRGETERFSDSRARVLIREKQTEAEKRFAVAKELCHILLDGEHDCSTDGVETIKGLLQDWHLARDNRIGHMEPTKPLVSEIMAHVAALELLYPDEYRVSDIAKLAGGEKTLQQIALEHDIPAYAVEQALDRHDDLKPFWDDIRQT
jgi:Zn-dependent peptidase ImmA (M78 family)